MEDGGGTLRVALRPGEDETVELSFTDTGPGIADGDLPRIFEPFFTTKPAGQGNGLGLVVAQGIVRDHGGRIEARCAPGEGATFHIRLPAASDPKAEAEAD
jgi:signal transduction histidine kinase